MSHLIFFETALNLKAFVHLCFPKYSNGSKSIDCYLQPKIALATGFTSNNRIRVLIFHTMFHGVYWKQSKWKTKSQIYEKVFLEQNTMCLIFLTVLIYHLFIHSLFQPALHPVVSRGSTHLATENCAHGSFYARLGIYRSRHKCAIHSDLKSGLTSCTQVRVSVDLWWGKQI